MRLFYGAICIADVRFHRRRSLLVDRWLGRKRTSRSLVARVSPDFRFYLVENPPVLFNNVFDDRRQINRLGSESLKL
jgi:hypothetical protein